MAIPTRPAGWPLWSFALGGFLLIGIAVGFIYLGRTFEPVHTLLSWLGRPRREHVVDVATPATFDVGNNGASRVHLPTLSDEWKKEQERLRKLFEDQQRINAKMLAELEALKKQKAEKDTKTEAKDTKPRPIKRAPGIKIQHEVQPAQHGRPTYALASGATKIPCIIESEMNSDVGNSYFTCKVTRPVKDSKTGQHTLIHQGDTVLARDEGANITVGNELLPAFATTLARRDGSSVDLGHVPVMDAVGINGLASEVHRHFWRNLMAGIMLGTINAGRQIVRQQVATEAGILVNSPGRVVEQTINRGIDTRPTILVHAGELATILLLKELQLTEID